MKLYNHAHAPNPRRVRIFAAEKGIELALDEVDILAGQSRTSQFLAKNSSGAVPVLELDYLLGDKARLGTVRQLQAQRLADALQGL